MTISKLWSAIFCSCGERGQGVAGELLRDPAADRSGADAPVELDRRRVPVQHVPRHVGAVALRGNARHVAEQRQADATTAMGFGDVDVLDEQSGAAGECTEQ